MRALLLVLLSRFFFTHAADNRFRHARRCPAPCQGPSSRPEREAAIRADPHRVKPDTKSCRRTDEHRTRWVPRSWCSRLAAL